MDDDLAYHGRDLWSGITDKRRWGSTWASVSAIPNANTWASNGTFIDIDASETNQIRLGDGNVLSGIRMFKQGEVIGFSIVLETARTAGTLTVRMVLNGVQQSGASLDLVIDGTNTLSNHIVLGTPISYAAGDILTMVAVSDASWTPANDDASAVFFYRDR